jgi:hypothetical protein
MEKSILALNGLILLAVGIAILILLWVSIFESLKKTPFFKDKTVAAILSTCVSLLCITGMFRFLGPEDWRHNAVEKTGGDSTLLTFILIGFATLGFAMVFVKLYVFLGKILGKNKLDKIFHWTERKANSTFHVDLGKGDSPAQEDFPDAFQETEINRDNNQSPKPTDRPQDERMHPSDIRKDNKSNWIKP